MSDMTTKLEKLRENPWYERIYKVTVAVKGFDGLVELIAGILLLIAPSFLHAILQALSGEALSHHGRFMRYIAENIAHIDKELAAGGLIIVVLFLISHGVVKLALVYALLKELLWAYPYALAVLFMFFVYQLYVFVVHPTLGMGLFTLLDAIIIWIVWGEWQKLKTEVAARQRHHKESA